MFKQIIFSLLSLSLATPALAQIPASDGYFFKGNPPAKRKEFYVVIEEHNNSKQLREEIKQYGINHADIHAFSVINPETNVCTIHIIKPSIDYMPEHIGHELVHCIYGAWHK